MGVPYLLKHLEPFASPVVFDRNSDVSDVVIDGPAFAYHIHRLVAGAKGLGLQSNNPLELVPECGELGDAAVAWLERLESNNMQVVAIFFDGGLPQWKEAERQTRYQDQINKLFTFRSQSTTKGEIWKPRREGPPKKDILDLICSQLASKTVPLSSSLPSNPFLVPAVIESLQSSRFGNVTSVVPGEADSYCTSHSGRPNCVILSNDSDLLLYDINPGDRIVMFKDIVFKETELLALQFDPHDIAGRLNLKSLLDLGFALHTDPHVRTLSKLLIMAKEKPGFKAGKYEEFASRYAGVQVGISNTEGYQPLAKADPRVSEYLLQSNGLKMDKTVGSEAEAPRTTTNSFNIYLPILFSDPTRSSPWAGSLQIRHLAYSFAGKTAVRPLRTREYLRRGARVTFNEFSPHLDEEILSISKALSTRFRQVSCCLESASLPKESLGLYWRAFGLFMLLSDLRADSRPIPSKADGKVLLYADYEWFGWEFVHVSAQMQAILYSCRILKQCVEFFIEEKSRYDGECIEALEAAKLLQDTLKGMPTLREMFPGFRESEELSDELSGKYEEVRRYIYHLTVGQGNDEAVETQEPAKTEKQSSKRRKKKTKKSTAITSSPTKDKPSNNLYSILS